MKSLTFYNPENGSITGQVTADDESIAVTMEADFLHWIDGNWSGDSYYVANSIATSRPSNPTTLSANTLQNLPVPCKIAINGTVYDCNDENATLELSQPIKYKIVVSAFPCLDKEFEIDYSA